MDEGEKLRQRDVGSLKNRAGSLTHDPTAIRAPNTREIMLCNMVSDLGFEVDSNSQSRKKLKQKNRSHTNFEE